MLKHPDNIYGQVEDLPAEITGAVDELVDGFGMIALASLTPMIFVMLFGIVRFGFRASGAG